MPKLIFLPHPVFCPQGKEIDAPSGASILDAALAGGIDIEHACEKSCACSTCHVLVREGLDGISEANDDEEDMLDKAWGLEGCSRLSCQAKVADTDLTIELPLYTINQVSERH